MSGDPEIIRLFPSFAAKSRVEGAEREAIDRALQETIAELRAGKPDLREAEVWQSPHGLHERPALLPLVTRVGEAAGRVLDFLRIGPRALSMTGCWINLVAPRGAVKMHSHPNNILSGVYYLEVAAGADAINFHDPRPQTAVIRPPVTELNAYNTDQVVVAVESGTLLLFPAWLPHSVDANPTGTLRVSVSFNLMFSADVKTMGAPLWGEAY